MLEHHDVLAERSLAALGGEPATCLEVLDAWRELRDAEWFHEFLLRESRVPPDEVARRREIYSRAEEDVKQLQQMARHPPFSQRRSHFEDRAADHLARERRFWALTLIEALPPALRRMLALSILVRVERRWHDDGFRNSNKRFVESALSAAVFPLFEQSARTWRRNLKPYATFVTEAWLLGPGERPTCAAWADSGGAFAVLSLPLSWFRDVWARGIALVDGCLVLAVDHRSRDDDALRVVALRWQREGREKSKSTEAPAHLTRAADGRWCLYWL